MIKKRIKIKSISSKASLNSCRIHVMPTSITDEDISVLFNSVLNILRRKMELETKRELISMNIHRDKLLSLLKEKQAEINRLKNEILYLKAKQSHE